MSFKCTRKKKTCDYFFEKESNIVFCFSAKYGLLNIFNYFISQASERAGILNPRIWLANDTHVTGPAFYDTAHGPDFFPAA